MKPLFSIAVTTYDRVDLLRDTLDSILNQTFTDFEILVGNDNPQRKIKTLFPDIKDPRIKWVDHPTNLGSIANTNCILQMCTGRFITTLSDDDLFHPRFLEKMHNVIQHNSDTNVVYSEFIAHNIPPVFSTPVSNTVEILTGSEWIAGYLSKKYKAIGCYGVYKKSFLAEIGWVHTLGNKPKISPYNDNLMAVQAGISDSVAFIPEPLVFFRLHSESISFLLSDSVALSSAQKEFFTIADEIFRANDKISLRPKYYESLLKWFVSDYFSVVQKDDNYSWMQVFNHYSYFLGKTVHAKNITSLIFLLNSETLRWALISPRQQLKSILQKLNLYDKSS